MTDDNALMTIRDVCEALKIHPRTLWLLRRAGGFIEPVMIGSVIRFRRGDLAAWVAAQ